MKTTFDLPDELIREMKLRAVMQRRTLRDLAADFLRQGLGMTAAKPPELPPTHSMVKLSANGLPVVHGSAKAPARRMSAQDLLKLEKQALAQEDMQRAGLPV
jgi:plasmid stability protein